MLSLSVPNISWSSSSIAATAPSPPRRVRFQSPIASAATFKASTKTFRSPYQGMATCTSTLYEVLGIPMCASSQEIKTAYRRLARVCHPDVAAMERKDKDSSADEFIRIHAAYSTLSDPAKRAVYDGKLYRKKRPLTVVSSPGYRGRNWETDQCW